MEDAGDYLDDTPSIDLAATIAEAQTGNSDDVLQDRLDLATMRTRLVTLEDAFVRARSDSYTTTDERAAASLRDAVRDLNAQADMVIDQVGAVQARLTAAGPSEEDVAKWLDGSSDVARLREITDGEDRRHLIESLNVHIDLIPIATLESVVGDAYKDTWWWKATEVLPALRFEEFKLITVA